MSEPISNEIFETFRIRERVKEQKKFLQNKDTLYSI